MSDFNVESFRTTHHVEGKTLHIEVKTVHVTPCWFMSHHIAPYQRFRAFSSDNLTIYHDKTAVNNPKTNPFALFKISHVNFKQHRFHDKHRNAHWERIWWKSTFLSFSNERHVPHPNITIMLYFRKIKERHEYGCLLHFKWCWLDALGVETSRHEDTVKHPTTVHIMWKWHETCAWMCAGVHTVAHQFMLNSFKCASHHVEESHWILTKNRPDNGCFIACDVNFKVENKLPNLS